MSLPASWDTVRVFATYKKFSDGTAAQGAVTFDPINIVTLPEGGGRTIVMPEPRTVTLDIDGKIDIQLPATDDPDLAPVTGLIYKVTERIAPTNRTYYIQVAMSGGDIDLATVTPLVPPPELASTRGPAGKSAYQSWLDDGHTGTEADFVAWLGAIPGPKGDPGANGTTLNRPTAALSSSAGVVTVAVTTGAEVYTLALTEDVTSWFFTDLPTSGKIAEIRIEVTQHASAAKTCVSPASAGRTAGGAWVASSVLSAKESLGLSIGSAGTVTLFPSGVYA